MSELLTQISEKPEIIASFTREQLAQARDALVEAGRAYVAGIKSGESEDATADLEAAREAQAHLATVNARIAEFEAEDAQIAQAVADLEAEFGADEPEVETEAVEEPTEEPELEPVLAAADPEPKPEPKPKVTAGAIAKRAPKPPAQPKTLVASASAAVKGARQFNDGRGIAVAAAEVFKATSPSRGGAPVTVASFDTLGSYTYQVNGDEQNDARVIGELLAEINKGTNALVASGGICAPAQPVYDFFSISEETGLIQLPTVGAPRGRLTYPVSASYATIRASAAWSAAVGQEHSNADDEAGTAKNTFQVTCPTTTTCTVAAYPVILQFGNFQQRFYPEFVEHSITESMRFHSHFVNAQLILDMVAAATAVGAGDTGGGGLVNVANLIGFEAARYRDNFRMSSTATLDLVAPTWVHDALVADLVARDSTLSFENARARTAAIFASLGVNVQFVQDWQSIADAGDGGWPTAADLLLYAPGTFVRLDGGNLNLGIVHDSTLNATNDFQTFTETFEAICEVGHDAWLINDLTICPRGSTAARVTLDCNPGFGS